MSRNAGRRGLAVLALFGSFRALWVLSRLVGPFALLGSFRTFWVLSHLLGSFRTFWDPFAPFGSFRTFWILSHLLDPFAPFGSFRAFWVLSRLLGPFAPLGSFRAFWVLSHLWVLSRLLGPFAPFGKYSHSHSSTRCNSHTRPSYTPRMRRTTTLRDVPPPHAMYHHSERPARVSSRLVTSPSMRQVSIDGLPHRQTGHQSKFAGPTDRAAFVDLRLIQSNPSQPVPSRYPDPDHGRTHT
ncbi:hypothetical protein BJ138DRAFT_1121081 [Hygrophoropsis aurantiaca]|uniref:Uncharacterized protein n=1 Tax=Hygrophoropsis aurantiaca TaxID=72124 RepID=A0ACB7ZPH9_9AGAM|nr:hypothetical protein BJ138DRAFT_1121081 [Hygrophoropsis aurantiaca]